MGRAHPICMSEMQRKWNYEPQTYTNPTSYTLSYTLSYTRKCLQIQDVGGMGVGNVGYFPKTFFGERKNASFRKLRKATLFGVHNNSIIRDRIGYAYA